MCFIHIYGSGGETKCLYQLKEITLPNQDELLIVENHQMVFIYQNIIRFTQYTHNIAVNKIKQLRLHFTFMNIPLNELEDGKHFLEDFRKKYISFTSIPPLPDARSNMWLDYIINITTITFGFHGSHSITRKVDESIHFRWEKYFWRWFDSLIFNWLSIVVVVVVVVYMNLRYFGL